MAEPYAIFLSEGAAADLHALNAYSRRLILDGLAVHLTHNPTQTSRRIKQMRPNSVAGWELRLGDFRILYDLDEQERTVIVQVVGEKVGNRLIVRGQEYSAHEGDRPERGQGQP